MICSPQFRVPMTIVYDHDDGTSDTYIRKEELGHGGFAIVYRVVQQGTNQEYAMKVISKERYNGPKGAKSFEKLKNEILIQKTVNHPNIVRSYGSFSDVFNYYIILEYCPGKTVHDLLLNSEKGYLSEAETRKILQDVIRAVVYLHRKHIIHRDLKLENYMIGSDGNVKIADFGISVILKHDDEKRFSIVGTPNYLSPEALQKVNKGYSYEVDIWSIGVSAFAMLTGHPPFEGGRKSITFERIKNLEYHFPSYIPISGTAKDFIRTILKIDPNRRPTAIDLANHPFMMIFNQGLVHLYRPSDDNENTTTTTFTTTTTTRMNFNSNIPGPVRPRIPLPPTSTKYVSHAAQNDDDDDFDFKNNETNEDTKSFTIPKTFVSRVTFHDGNLGYLLENGIVGACFNDHSRIVMDPTEKFIQYYNNVDSFPEVFDLEKEEETSEENIDKRLQRKISLLKRFSRSLKKSKLYYQASNENLDEFLPFPNVKSFVNKDNTLLFKFNDNNVQVNFNDHMKLIIFTSNKEMCLVRSIKDKCSLLKIDNVVSKHAHNDEYKKYMKAREMLNQI